MEPAPPSGGPRPRRPSEAEAGPGERRGTGLPGRRAGGLAVGAAGAQPGGAARASSRESGRLLGPGRVAGSGRGRPRWRGFRAAVSRAGTLVPDPLKPKPDGRPRPRGSPGARPPPGRRGRQSRRAPRCGVRARGPGSRGLQGRASPRGWAPSPGLAVGSRSALVRPKTAPACSWGSGAGSADEGCRLQGGRKAPRRPLTCREAAGPAEAAGE